MIRFGVAGWDYKDWWGPVYPASRPHGFDPLVYLSRFFDMVEINSTYYGAGSPKAAETWVRRVRSKLPLRERLTAFENRYNTLARPFAWRYTKAHLNELLKRIDDHRLAA